MPRGKKFTAEQIIGKLREAAVVVEPATGAIVHAFTSGTVVQIFQLEAHGVATHGSAGVPAEADEPSK
jgi:hypothetical protein